MRFVAKALFTDKKTAGAKRGLANWNQSRPMPRIQCKQVMSKVKQHLQQKHERTGGGEGCI